MKHIQRIERRADFQMLTGGSRLLAVLVAAHALGDVLVEAATTLRMDAQRTPRSRPTTSMVAVSMSEAMTPRRDQVSYRAGLSSRYMQSWLRAMPI